LLRFQHAELVGWNLCYGAESESAAHDWYPLVVQVQNLTLVLSAGVFVPLFCFGQFVLVVLLDGAFWLARRKYLSEYPGANLIQPGAGIAEQVFKYLLTPRRKWKLTPCLREFVMLLEDFLF
jgi:hypothetical protein